MTNDKDNRKQQDEKQNEKETQDHRDDWGEGLTPEMEEALKDIFKRYDKTLRNLKDR